MSNKRVSSSSMLVTSCTRYRTDQGDAPLLSLEWKAKSFHLYHGEYHTPALSRAYLSRTLNLFSSVIHSAR
jgi:hypothetical protein